MHAAYYALRRFSPYQGMVQVVDVGAARAYSTDGRHWTVRLQNPTAHAAAFSGTTPADVADDLMQALNERPTLPFPQQDRIELWLLDKATALPLALVKTRRSLEEMEEVQDPTWRPFLSSDSGFCCAALNVQAANPGKRMYAARAQDVLEREVNLAARPLPALQWFQRIDDGSGIGWDGLRVEPQWSGRQLPREAFPELLVSDNWNDGTLSALVRDYHAWHAPLLLAHQNLSSATRSWLETAARARPLRLLDNYAMFPEVLDRDAMQVALVSARLMQAG